ncbi:MAG TPA: hypothetical protein VG711_04915 [Phycisphaerales bacterium]|nr:hypothetical protein [Phycisphaerales bacterium]
MRTMLNQSLIALSLGCCLLLTSCDESGSDSASNPPPPPQPLHIDHPAQSTLGKAYQAGENLQDKIEKQQRDLVKQADAIYGGSESDDESTSEPEPE